MSVRRNLTIEQGATYEMSYTIAAPGVDDFTGYVVDSQIRAPSGEVLATFTVTWADQASAAPTLTFTLPAATTAALAPAVPGVHDARLSAPASGPVTRLHEGTVTVTPAVTRDDA